MFLPVWHKSEWAALRPKFFIFLGQIHPRFWTGHEQRRGLVPSLLVTWYLIGLSSHLQRVCGCAGLAQRQKCLGKEGQEGEIRVDVPCSDSLGRNWHQTFVFDHYLLGMQVGKCVVRSLSVPVTVAGRGMLCWVSCTRISAALVLPG